jgi:hypothetical protein
LLIILLGTPGRVSIGKFSYDTFSHTRATLSVPDYLESALTTRYPPYTENKLAFARLLVGGFLPSTRSTPVGTIGDPSAVRAPGQFRSVLGILLRKLTKSVSPRIVVAACLALVGAREFDWKWLIAGLTRLLSFGRDKQV